MKYKAGGQELGQEQELGQVNKVLKSLKQELNT
jgi:hypothetical protein